MAVKKKLSENSCRQGALELLTTNSCSPKLYLLLLLVLFNLVFITGCTYKVTRYEYKIPEEIEYSWGKAGARLISIGHKSTESEVMTGPPYELFIWFHISSKVKGSATVTSVELYDVEDKKLIFKANEILKSNFDQRTNYSSVNFSFGDLDLKYIRYKLVLKFKVKTGKVTTEDKATFYFEKDFEQFRSMKWWEAAKGI